MEHSGACILLLMLQVRDIPICVGIQSIRTTIVAEIQHAKAPTLTQQSDDSNTTSENQESKRHSK